MKARVERFRIPRPRLPRLPFFRIPHPNLLTVVLSLTVALAASAIASIILTAFVEMERSEHRETVTRELNGNQAMIFAICSALGSRDRFMQDRLDSIKRIDLKYEAASVHMSATERALFHEHTQLAIRNDADERKKFVKFDCVKGMETAYRQGYENNDTPTGKPPVPIRSPHPIPKLSSEIHF